MLIALGFMLIVCGVVAVGVVGIRALPRVLALPEEDHRPKRERAVKERILRERIHRRVNQWAGDVQRRARAGSRRWVTTLERAYRRLRLLAQEYVAAPPGQERMTCDTAIAAASSALAEGAYDRAEEHYLSCLKIDAKHREAYLGLARLYRERREEALASETYAFLRKLYPEDGEIAFAHAELLRERGKYAAAIREMQHAVAHAPRNPKYLDFAIELAVMGGKRAAAARWFTQLKEANPDNQKLVEFAERIAGMEE